jgi:hypothetical protein
MEKQVHLAVVNYLKLQYPKVIFRSDYGAGCKLTIGQAKAQKAIQNGMAWPDLFIAEARGGYFGMFIELKDEGINVTDKSGNILKGHITEQRECLENLRNNGYLTYFGLGFDNTKIIIDSYLGELETPFILPI